MVDRKDEGESRAEAGTQFLAEQFQAHRAHVRAVAYRILGSPDEADDAVQEVWLRLSRSDTGAVANLGGWLTTVVARVSLNMLQVRANRREALFDASLSENRHAAIAASPEDAVLMTDSVGLALLVVLEMLTPAERLAFVLHDLFAMPFEEIAPIVGKSPVATRQLASRARRRDRGAWRPGRRRDVRGTGPGRASGRGRRSPGCGLVRGGHATRGVRLHGARGRGHRHRPHRRPGDHRKP
jgi:RNA polymerase sigma factor (sigma-70 family)